MIKTTFRAMGQQPFSVDMPHAVRVGESIEIERTGENWEVVGVIWVIDELTNVVELEVRMQ